MKRLLIFLLIINASQAAAQSKVVKRELLERFVARPTGPNFAIVASKLRLNEDPDRAYRQLDTLLAKPYGDMFWMYGCAGLYFATQDVLKPEYKERIRWCWKHFTPYRGDTENHFLMYYGSLYLMTQAWPNLADTEWFEGKSSYELHRESKEYLDHWIDETARYGITEWDSPRYGYYYITPLVLLAEYTKDARMKHRFEMMLDLMLADYATEYLAGSYCGAHSRVSDQCAIDPRSAEITAYGDYFFADSITHLQPDVAFTALTSYECPEVIRHIAFDRSKPFEKHSLKRGRTTLRYTNVRNAPVYKYDYMTEDYCLGSMQGGIVQPIQQQSWSLVFNSAKPHNIITGLHPYVSAEELGMFFPEYPSFMLEKIGGTKAGYKNENKWVGGSPFEKIYQKKNMLVALYDLPDTVSYHHIDLFIPGGSIDEKMERTEDSSMLFNPGWRMLQFDSTLIGIYLFSPYRIYKVNGNLRIRMWKGDAGYFVYCGSLRETSMSTFATKLLTSDIEKDSSRVYSRGDNGRTFELALQRPNGDEDKWLYHSAPMRSKKGSGVIVLSSSRDKMSLDFNR